MRRPYNQVNFNSRYRFLKKALVNMDILWKEDRNESVYAMDKDGNPVDTLDSYMVVNLSIMEKPILPFRWGSWHARLILK